MNEIILYGALGVILIVFVYLIYKQLQSDKQHHDNIIGSETAVRMATAELNAKRNNLFHSMEEVYGKEIADIVDKGNLYVGMPNFLLIVAKGYANNVKESFYKNMRIEKWYYGEYVNRLGNYNYELEITLEDDEVVGWKNLK